MTGSSVYIRQFRPADQAAARRLINEGLGERFGVVDESFNPDLDDIAAHYTARGHTFLVALGGGGALLGTGCLIYEPDGATGQMVRVSVRRDLRGNGIGRALVERLLAEAQARGLRRVWMETNAGWTSAIRLYERCGFTRYKSEHGLVFLERMLGGKDEATAGATGRDM